ncbi:MAG: hypothetical protein IH941_09535 [Acidobacteria bacterium]|nr:hypothetical protein [Acidobacteriota bacterium]
MPRFAVGRVFHHTQPGPKGLEIADRETRDTGPGWLPVQYTIRRLTLSLKKV